MKTLLHIIKTSRRDQGNTHLSQQRVLHVTRMGLVPALGLCAMMACQSRNSSNEAAQLMNDPATKKGEDWEEEFEGGSEQKEQALVTEAVEVAKQSADNNKEKFNVPFIPRDAHPKAHGCVKGTFTVFDGIPLDFKTGLFAKAKTYKVWSRFSNAGLMAGNKDDEKKDGRGMALKIIDFDTDEARLAKGQEDSKNFDLNLVNIPTFPTETIDQYIKLQKNPLSLGLAAPGVLLRLQTALNGAPTNHPFGFPYFSITPFKLGKKAVKYRATPCNQNFKQKVASGENYMRESMKNAFEKGQTACFDLQAQLYVNKRQTPLETTTVEWKEADAPFSRPLARIEFGPENKNFANEAQDKFCEALSFNPWRVTKDHRPLGRLNRARQNVYEAVSRKRGLGTLPKEPTGDETF